VNVLVLNAGSSSLKFQLVRTDQERIASDTDERSARGVIERIGGEALIRLETGAGVERTAAPIRDHRGAVEHALRWLDQATGTGLRGSARKEET
jgi:acetate kinase